MIRIGREARAVLNALRSRSGFRMPRRRRISMLAPLTRHFLLSVVESHFHLHAALVSRGHSGGALRMLRPPTKRGEWLFLPVFTVAVLIVVAA